MPSKKKQMTLAPCRLCGGAARELSADDFHMSFAEHDNSDGTVEFNFLHFGAINCAGCGLTLPFFDTGDNRLDNIKFWNGEGT